MSKIDKTTKIAKALTLNKKAPEIFFKYGLHCIGCALSAEETIEQGASAHGLSEKEITSLIKELNQ
ncbi:disulfide oxidoreductase [archaeon]|nr:disulfide oxidoreductase [archaeon]|tara:strand:+ start:4952 stop:5149 length:198 start_codon:yes stop_codon:yes gene_type:complete